MKNERPFARNCTLCLLVFHIKMTDYCIQLAKAQGEQIGRKAPLFSAFGEILSLYHGT